MTDRGVSTASAQGDGVRGALTRAAIWLLLAAAIWFAWRGPITAWSGFSDFALVYAQARVWLQGGDPYDHPTLLAAMQAARIDAPASYERERWPAIYPPTMHPLMAPLAALPWTAAKAVWLLINVAATLLAIALAARLAELRGPPAVLFAAAALACAPLLSGIAKGQLALVALVLALDAWSMTRSMTRDRRDDLQPLPLPGGGRERVVADESTWLSDIDQTASTQPSPSPSLRGRGVAGRDLRGNWTAGLLLGLGLALKPQIAGVIWLLLAWRGRWRCALTGAMVAACLGAIGTAWLWFNDVAWLAALRANLADNAVGGSGDPTAANPLRFQLINLHYLLAVLVGDDRAAIDWGVRIAAAMFVLPALALARRRGDRDARDGDLLLLGVLGAVSLLAVYHRPYDAVLLLPAAAWSVREGWLACRCARGRLALLSLPVLAVFLLPGAALPHRLAESGLVPAAIARTWFWQAVVMPHQVWALLLLALLWLAALVFQSSSAASDQTDAA